MKHSVVLPVLFSFCSNSWLVNAESIQRDYDLSSVPSTDISLVKQEHKVHHEQTLESFKNVVQDVVASSNKTNKTKRARTAKTNNKREKSRKIQQALSSLLAEQKEVSQGLVDIMQKQLEDSELQQKRVSLHLKKMPVKDALSLLSKSSDVQFVVDGDVTGTVQDLKLDNISLSAALHSILSSNDPRLALIKEFGVWRIMKMQTARELFAGMVSQERERDFISAVIPIAYAKWNDLLKQRIEKLWQGITLTSGDKQNGYLVFDDVNRKVFCRSHAQNVKDFTYCLQEIDVKIPQVRIDARVVLAKKDFEEAFGFRWGGVYNRRESVKRTTFVGLGPVTVTDKGKEGDPANKNTPYENIMGWALNLLPTTVNATLSKIPFVFGNNDMNTKRLTFELDLAEKRNEIKTILKPSLLVYNEENAEILVGEEMPQEVRLDETVESKLTNITTVNYKAIGMKIKVKPFVAPNHEAVFLDIFVENSYVTPPDIPGIKTLGTERSSFNYTIRTSRSVNRVLLRSGQTTMIGGLISNKKDSEKYGIPFIQDIPILGLLFKSSRKLLTDEQLMIFITPTLIDI